MLDDYENASEKVPGQKVASQKGPEQNFLEEIRKDPSLKKNDDVFLNDIEHAHFNYFVDQSDPDTGLTKDRSTDDSAASIAAVGFSLSSYPIGVERGWISRDQAADYTLKVLKTLWNAPQGDAAEGMAGDHGLFYHFLNMKTGTRMWKSELSTIDTALLMSGVLFAKNYFNGDSNKEAEIRNLADKLYRRVDWSWMQNPDKSVSMGWNPETGFIKAEWQGYCEAMILMLLGLGSPTHPLAKGSWDKWLSTETMNTYGGQTYIDFRPLFGHQYSQAWIDFRGIMDDKTKSLGFDYFENSRRATLAQYAYGEKNPLGFKDYSKLDWGWTACDGPGDAFNKSKSANLSLLPSYDEMLEKVNPGTVAGRSILNSYFAERLKSANKRFLLPDDKQEQHFFSYMARGAPDSVDDGTIAPTAAASSIAFAPEVVLPTLRHWRQDRPEIWTKDGFKDAFNPTADPGKRSGWVDSDMIGIDQGPIVMMTENYRSGMVWNIMKKDSYLQDGLKKAGFTGGWLGR